jgi:hypothetical protein
MTQKTLGTHTVQIEEIRDAENNLMHYNVTSDSFVNKPFRVLSEDEVTLERVEQHIEMLNIFS